MTGREWWFASVYPGTPSAMDAAVAGAGRWARQTVHDIGADCWYFIRYVDPTGVHVRLRIRAHPDALDGLAHRSGPLHELADSADPSPSATVHRRLIPEAGTLDVSGPPGVRLDVYEPELDKYGTDHLPDAERCFQESSELMLDLDTTTKPATGARAALAVHLMRQAANAVLTDAEIRDFWPYHRAYWGNSLRPLRLTKEALRSRLAVVTRAMEDTPPADGELDRLGSWSDALARRIHAAGPSRRVHLFFHHLHMSMNRLGYLPAEEAMLGLVASGGGM
ncbi:thiopeptide-type bacteriocin biosynthesis protein [Allokutzneria oryzae]|uniref:Thiopeptide-type bacteriocin biosynthesis protein n=1 Tax=Allokutzneria oryzae TaxID=1378989 RepID=A0ABV5ZS48_9PSEU